MQTREDIILKETMQKVIAAARNVKLMNTFKILPNRLAGLSHAKTERRRAALKQTN